MLLQGGKKKLHYRWKEVKKMLNDISLVLIDEIHILNEERGSIIETLISRFKCNFCCLQ